MVFQWSVVDVAYSSVTSLNQNQPSSYKIARGIAPSWGVGPFWELIRGPLMGKCMDLMGPCKLGRNS